MIWGALLQLEQTQWLEPAEIERCQLEQARLVVEHSIAHVPYYREVLPAAGISAENLQSLADWRRIPPLPRRTYQEQAQRFEAERLPPGTTATRITQTSGSSGTPTPVFQTNLVHFWWNVFLLRDQNWCGIDTGGRMAVIRSLGSQADRNPLLLEGDSVPFCPAPLGTLVKNGIAYRMDIRQDPRRQLQWLRQVTPDYLLSYPPNLEVLAGLVRREGRVPGLKVIQAISDTLSEEARAAIESAFGVPVKNTYSCTEAGYLASPCPSGPGLHVHAENVILEVLDEAGQPCAAGQTGRVLLSTLHNFRGPLLRYELGDQVTVGERCSCGRGLSLLTNVQGKNTPMFLLADGRLKSSALLAFRLKKLGGHWQHQVVQRAVGHVVVRLAIQGDWTAEHESKLRQAVRDFFEQPLRIDLEILDCLPVPPSGKFQSMVREVSLPG